MQVLPRRHGVHGEIKRKRSIRNAGTQEMIKEKKE
jgi:hypothetical protein